MKKKQSEYCFNLLMTYDSNIMLTQVKVVVHMLTGSDNTKLKYLQSNVNTDLVSTTGLIYNQVFTAPINMGTSIYDKNPIILNACKHLGIGFPSQPLMCCTPIHNGRVYFIGVMYQK